jgi:hypothetical protein
MPKSLRPPHTIISVPVQTLVWEYRAVGAFVMLVTAQLSEPGLYFPPVFKLPGNSPPHMIISLSVQTAVCPALAMGALAVDVAIQLSVFGLYLPPVFKGGIGVGVGGGGPATELRLFRPTMLS